MMHYTSEPMMTASQAWWAVGIWAMCHLAYPLWYPLGGSMQAALLNYSILSLTGLILLRALLPSLQLESEENHPHWISDLFPKDRLVWILLVFFALIRFYPMTLPIHLWQGGDEGSHMGFAALPFKILARKIPIPWAPAFWLLGGGIYYYRMALRSAIKRFVLSLARFEGAAMSCCFFLAAVYFVCVFKVIHYFSVAGYPTLARDFLRFPPLGHWIHQGIYAFFGVSNWTGRIQEFIFFCAGAVVAYRWAFEFRSSNVARLVLILYLFLPPFDYYAVRGSQTHGELLIYLLTAYAYGRWVREGDPRYFFSAVLTVSIGTLYRYTVLPMVPVLGLLMGFSYFKKSARESLSKRALTQSVIIAIVFSVPWAISYLFNGLRPYEGGGGRPILHALADPIRSLPTGLSPFVTFVVLAGFLRALWKPKDQYQWSLLAWFGAYYLFISMDLGSNIRLTLPMYPPLLFWGAEWMDAVLPAGRLIQGLAAAGLLIYLLAVGIWIHVPPMPREFTLRHSLNEEYVPLEAAADAVDRLPDGARLLSIDCSRGCFSLYLRSPDHVEWRLADSRSFHSTEEIYTLCRREKIPFVLFVSGTEAAFGQPMNRSLFDQFMRDERFKPRAFYQLGQNSAALKELLYRP